MNSVDDILNKYSAQGAEPAPSPVDAVLDKHLGDRESRRAAIEAEYAKDLPDPLEGMGTADKFWAGVGSGMTSIVQGAGNMLGLVDDATIKERQDIDAPLSGTTAGSIGQFTGETAALLPLGFVGRGAQGAAAALKAKAVLPTAAKVLASRGAAVGAENALAGAIAANPGERWAGAGTGLALGHVLNRTMAGVNRLGVHGVAKVSDSAKALQDLVEKKIGKRPFVPLLQAADKHAGSVTAKTKSWMDAVSLLPSAKEKMANQAENLMDDLYETNIRQAFGKAKADVGSSVLRKTQDVRVGLEAAKNAGKSLRYTPTQQVLESATRKAPVRGRYTPRQLIRAAESQATGDLTNAPLRQTANLMEDVVSRPVGTSNVEARTVYHNLANTIGFVVDRVPYLGETLASESMQNFLMGNAVWQRRLREAAATGTGQAVIDVMSGIRRAMAAQPLAADADRDTIEHWSNEARSALENF